MEFKQILFYIFSFLLISGSLAMILSRNTIKAALFLILAFFSSAGLWLLLEAEFLFITLILVYVGAVMVLFLFVIKMLNIEQSTLKARFVKYLPLGIIVVVIVIAEMALVLGYSQFGLSVVGEAVVHSADYSNIKELALQLYTNYVYPFELAAVLLLVAIIAAITLARSDNLKRKKQSVSAQINVNPSDRLRFAKINIKNNKEGEK